MIPKFKAWDKNKQCIKDVNFAPKGISFDDVEFMQSTGLEDANGNEIFEADVLRNNAQEYIFLAGNGFYLECLNVMDPDCISPYEPDVLDKSEIIGNIFENPTLEYNFIGLRPKEVEEEK